MQARELMKQWWANPDDLPSVPEGVQGLLARMKAINDRGGVRAARNRLQKAKEDLKVLKAKVRSCGSVCAHGLGQLLFIPPKVLRHQQLPVSWQGLYVESDSDRCRHRLRNRHYRGRRRGRPQREVLLQEEAEGVCSTGSRSPVCHVAVSHIARLIGSLLRIATCWKATSGATVMK